MAEERRKGERRRRVSRVEATQVQDKEGATSSSVQIDDGGGVVRSTSTADVQRFTAGDLDISIASHGQDSHGEVQ